MGRTVHIADLRSKDPKTLEVLIQDAVRKPIVQLSAETLIDLVALSEVDELPKQLKRTLDGFAGRVASEIADMPDGGVIGEFLEGFDEVDAAKVPGTLRECLVREADRDERSSAGRKRVQSLVDKWTGVPPETIKLSTTQPKIQRASAAPPSDEELRRPRGAPRQKTATPSRKVVTDDEKERDRWLADHILVKLTGYREQGLAEAVLIAGIRHEAREEFPDVQTHDITKVLRTLLQAGQVRKSAGRWSRTGRLW